MKVFDYSVRVLNGKNNPAHETSEGYVPMEHGEQYTLLLRNFSKRDALATISVDGKNVACVKVPAEDKVKVDAPFNSDQKFTFYKKNSEEGEDLGLGEMTKDDLGSIEVKFVAVEKEFQWKTVTINERIVYVPVYHYWNPWWTIPNITISPSIWYATNGTGSITSSYTTTNLSNVSLSGSGSSNTFLDTATTAYTVDGTGSSNVTLTCSNTGLSSGGTGLSGMADYIPLKTEELNEEFEKYLDEETATTIFLRLVHKGETYKPKPSKVVGYSNKKPAPID